MRGDISDEDYARLSRLWSFSKAEKWFGNKRTPTDLDARFFVDFRGSFIWLEMKTEGPGSISYGQEAAYEALLYRGRPHDILILCYHDRLERCKFPEQVQWFQIWKWDQCINGIAKTELMDGNDDDIQWWIEEWKKHRFEKPNHFMTTFRRRAGIYPGVPKR